MVMLSTILSSNAICGYCFATSCASLRKRPSVYLRMFALWMAVTFFLLFSIAYLNAKSTILLLAKEEITLSDMALSPLIELYSDVQVLRVLPYHNKINIFVPCWNSRYRLCGPHVCEQVKFLPER